MRNVVFLAVSLLMLATQTSYMGSARKDLRSFQQGKSPILSLRFTSGGSHLISASTDGKVVKWDVKTGQRVWQISLDGQSATNRESSVSHITDMDLSSDGRTLALSYRRDLIIGNRLASRDEGRIVLFDARIGRETKVLTDNTKPRGVAFSPNDHLLASTGSDKTVRLWNLETGQQMWSISLKEPIVNFAFSPDGKLLAIATEPPGWVTPPEPMIGIYDAKTGTLNGSIPRERRNVGGLVFSPDSRLLAIVSDNLNGAQIDLWDLTTSERKRTLTDHEGGITTIAYSPDGRWLVSGDLRHGRGNVIVRELATNTAPRKHKLSAGVSSLSFSPDSSLLAVGTEKGQIMLLSP